MSIKISLLFIYATICLFACTSNHKESSAASDTQNIPVSPLFFNLDSTRTGIHFRNDVVDTKDFNILNYRNFYNGGGVGIGDINNDHLPDIFLTCNTCPDRLYLNKGNLQFQDISHSAHIEGKDAWTTGVAMADVNGDGWLDIYVCYSGDQVGKSRENELFINQKDNTFKEEAAAYGLNDRGLTTHAAFFDYDLDGDLDCFMLNNSFKDIRKFDVRTDSRELRDSLGGQRFYRNDGGKYKDISVQAHVYGSKIGFGLGVSVSDLNSDGYPDMYISNDFFERDYMYINAKDGTFTESLPQSMGHTSQFSMGSDIGDIDNDGLPDIFSTDMLPNDLRRIKVLSKFNEFNTEAMRVASNFHNQYMQNCLQWNRGNLKFSEVACLSGVEASDWSWGALLFDMDNNGLQDIFVSNGIYKDITNMDFSDFLANKTNVDKVVLEKGVFDFRDFLPYIPSTPLSNKAYLNQGSLIFKESAHDLGLGTPSFSNGAAYGDLDLDGDYDLVINNINATVSLFENKSQNHFISITLVGTNHNTSALGSKIIVQSKASTQTRELFIHRGFQSSVDPTILFGLADQDTIDFIKIIWPDRSTSTIPHPALNSRLIIAYDSIQHTKDKLVTLSNKQGRINKENDILIGNLVHKENDYVDFHSERLIPNMLSAQGPKMAVGDLNGDGLEDVVVGGAKGDYTKLYLQNAQGKLLEKKDQELIVDSMFEDTDIALYDHDGDGDLDLLVGSGGNEYSEGTEALATRLYYNDGRGKFIPMPMLSPPMHINVSCLRLRPLPNGPTLLFAGGRSVSKAYGLSPTSYVMMNISGRWTDITPDFLKKIGMVTDAVWTDYNKDGFIDLIVVGEWMPLTFIKNNGKSLVLDFQLENSSGWWNSIAEVDLNQDGFKDYILGNWGLNSRFRASATHPMHLYINDFDKNQTPDPIICIYNPDDGVTYPYNTRADMLTQMPFLKKDNLKYGTYANKTYEQLFTPEQRKNGISKEVTNLASGYLMNQEGKSFNWVSFSTENQIAPIFTTLAVDSLTYFFAGNFYKSKPEIGRMDASYGSMASFDPRNNMFTSISKSELPLYLTGEIKDLKAITIKNKKYILVAKNNDALEIYSYNKP